MMVVPESGKEFTHHIINMYVKNPLISKFSRNDDHFRNSKLRMKNCQEMSFGYVRVYLYTHNQSFQPT